MAMASNVRAACRTVRSMLMQTAVAPRAAASVSRGAFRSVATRSVAVQAPTLMRRGLTSAVLASAAAAATAAFIATEEKAECAQSPYMGTSVTPNLEKLLQEDPTNMRYQMEDLVLRTQADFCRAMSAEDGNAKFIVDAWQRPEGGGGVSCVLQDAPVFEKGGCNVSVVQGTLPPRAVQEMSAQRQLGPGPHTFFAAGVSCVVHPRSPMNPAVHYNYRYFEVVDANGQKYWWFGGGADLTPNYLDKDDAIHFHKTLKAACDKHDPKYYSKFKKWCDEYFYIKHRGEHRGVGGVFFDDLSDSDPQKCFRFVKDMCKTVVPMYIPLIAKHKHEKYTDKQKEWQLLRRGRYVEFNLVYDRGTKFGLFTPNARIESIFISLPLNVRWEYMHETKKGTPEDEMQDVVKKARDWIPLE